MVTWKTKQKRNLVSRCCFEQTHKKIQLKRKQSGKKGSQNKYAGPFYSLYLYVSLLTQVKPFTNEKIISMSRGNHTLNKLSSHSNHLHMEKNKQKKNSSHTCTASQNHCQPWSLTQTANNSLNTTAKNKL